MAGVYLDGGNICTGIRRQRSCQSSAVHVKNRNFAFGPSSDRSSAILRQADAPHFALMPSQRVNLGACRQRSQI